MRWHAHYHTSGTGHIYHGRFKSFPVECEAYLYSVCRHVQRNPLRVNLMHRAEHWRWSSLWRRIHGDDQPRAFPQFMAGTNAEPLGGSRQRSANRGGVEALRRSVQRGCPFGSDIWQKQMAARLGLSHTLRPIGRPKKLTASEQPAPS
jgi:REP-associated tyrosine transposase